MKNMFSEQEAISFENIPGLPDIQATFTACRIGPDGYLIDIIDFSKKSISRWPLARIEIPRALELLEKNIPAERLPFGVLHTDFYKNFQMNLHVAQLSAEGTLLVCMGDFTNGFFNLAVDTRSGKVTVLPKDYADPLMLYGSTGGFSADNRYWIFIRWPLEDSLDILCGRLKYARCSIGRLSLPDLGIEPLYEFENNDGIHQIICTTDARYAVFASFKWDAGRACDELITVDLASHRHWRTSVPAPVPAHCELDPLDPALFYLSCHNFHLLKGNVILDGPACLIKMRIMDGQTIIEGKYSDAQFFRLSQHVPFLYDGRVLVAVTNLPNKIDLIDAQSMTLWRRVELFKAEPLVCAKGASLACPAYPGSCFAINPSKDGSYLVLEDSDNFIIYSVRENRLLDARIPRFLPSGYKGTGHTRAAGG